MFHADGAAPLAPTRRLFTVAEADLLKHFSAFSPTGVDIARHRDGKWVARVSQGATGPCA
jgi:hypothetical protein